MAVKKPLLMNQPQIGRLIRTIRLETGLTQEQFAAQLGITYSTLNRWENHHFKPSRLAIQKIRLLAKGQSDKELLSR